MAQRRYLKMYLSPIIQHLNRKGYNMLQLTNMADGVEGHFAISRYNHEGGFREFWNEESYRFCSAGTVYIGEKAALEKLHELKKPAFCLLTTDGLVSEIKRQLLFITMTQFAKSHGVTIGFISAIMKGRKKPTEKIANAMGYRKITHFEKVV